MARKRKTCSHWIMMSVTRGMVLEWTRESGSFAVQSGGQKRQVHWWTAPATDKRLPARGPEANVQAQCSLGFSRHQACNRRRTLRGGGGGGWEEQPQPNPKTAFNTSLYRPLSHSGHFESQENKKLCFCTSSLALDERLAVQNLLFQHCAIKVYCAYM